MKPLLLSSLTAATLLFTAPASAQETVSFDVIGQEPYGFQNDQGEFDGYFYHIANRLLSEANYEGTARPIPLKRLIRDLRQRHTDCSIFANRDYSQEKLIEVDTIGHSIDVGVVPKAGLTITHRDELKKIRIGAPVGMTFGTDFDTDDSYQRVDTPDYRHSALMLQRDRIDAVIGVIESIHFGAITAVGSYEAIYDKPYFLRRTPISLYCHQDVPETTQNRLQTALAKMKTSGEVQTIISRFFKAP